MSTTPHPHEQLSALVDDALAPAERRAVESHLAGCARCRAYLAELRATAALVASLPDPVPSRRLVPRLATVPLWMAPLRTLATLASGLSVFLFIASAILGNIATLSGGSATTALNAPAAAPAASPVPSAQPAPADRRDAAPGVAQASAAASAAAEAQRTNLSDSAKFATSSSPGVGSAAPPQSANAESAAVARYGAPRSVGPSPWLWLGLALITGAIALALQRKLRST